MSGEKTKTAAAGEGEPQKRERAKVAIVGLIDGVKSILVLTKSDDDDTNPGGVDWPGGNRDPRDKTPRHTAIRETGEELQGVVLEELTELTEEPITKIKGGVEVITHFFAARARFPHGPHNITLSHEHSDSGWKPLDEFADGEDTPNKFRRPVASESGRIILDRLASTPLESPQEELIAA